jgi:hypothetical protein
MPTIDEKRVYDATTGATRALLATGVGVVAVSVSDDIVGEFGIDHQCTAHDAAASRTADGDSLLAVATDGDVLVGDYDPTGHGPATAVGGDTEATVLAAAPDGTVSRLVGELNEGDREATKEGSETAEGHESGETAEGHESGETAEGHESSETAEGHESEERADASAATWQTVGTVTEPRAVDGRLIAGSDGLHRVRDGTLESVGLSDAHDVVAHPVPYAATATALYSLGNGWQTVLHGEFRAVAAGSDGDRIAAATPEAVYTRGGPWSGDRVDSTEEGATPGEVASAGSWQRHAESGVVALAVAGDSLLAVTASGSLRVTVGDGWRGRTLGVPDVSAVVVLGEG